MRIQLDEALTTTEQMWLVMLGTVFVGIAIFSIVSVIGLVSRWVKSHDRTSKAVATILQLICYLWLTSAFVYVPVSAWNRPYPVAIEVEEQQVLISYTWGHARVIPRPRIRGVDFTTDKFAKGGVQAVIRFRTTDGDVVLRAGKRGLVQHWQNSTKQVEQILGLQPKPLRIPEKLQL